MRTFVYLANLPIALAAPPSTTPAALSTMAQNLRAAFSRFDRNGDGCIDKNELIAILTRPGPNQLSREDAIELFDAIDEAGDGNGVIDFREFANAWGADEGIQEVLDVSQVVEHSPGVPWNPLDPLGIGAAMLTAGGTMMTHQMHHYSQSTKMMFSTIAACSNAKSVEEIEENLKDQLGDFNSWIVELQTMQEMMCKMHPLAPKKVVVMSATGTDIAAAQTIPFINLCASRAATWLPFLH